MTKLTLHHGKNLTKTEETALFSCEISPLMGIKNSTAEKLSNSIESLLIISSKEKSNFMEVEQEKFIQKEKDKRKIATNSRSAEQEVGTSDIVGIFVPTNTN